MPLACLSCPFLLSYCASLLSYHTYSYFFALLVPPIKEIMEDLDTNSFEPTNPIDFETVDSMSIELVTFDTELSAEIEPNDRQDFNISKDVPFMLWDEAEAHINGYAKAIGFSLRRKRVEVSDNGEVRRCTFECTHSGEVSENKVIDISQQRNRKSNKISCPWHINLSKLKLSAVVVIISIVGEHNHQLHPNVSLYAPKHRRLSSQILKSIEFYVKKGKLGSKQISSLLIVAFPDYMIYKCDLYNAIQNFERHQDNIIEKYKLLSIIC
ncbi:9207_t:CDS:2 [Dentiscutata heterogama]|uniref:9207_t:CDS:1 n=1 Tax=Dentiscutata heterogama TaxID=1316150 RepID=A0ACA9LW83_9GLOM|nr:9207_t:CDS:2 [Dentiscutata heterogama]